MMYNEICRQMPAGSSGMNIPWTARPNPIHNNGEGVLLVRKTVFRILFFTIIFLIVFTIKAS